MIERFRTLVAKSSELFAWGRCGKDLEDEIQVHIQMLTERYTRQGMDPRDAPAAARRQFGNSDSLRERHHVQASFYALTVLWRDLRFGARQSLRNPILTCIGITSLALGIGANTAVFTAAKAVLFDSLPVDAPDQLRMLTWVGGHEQPVPPVWGDEWSNESGGLTSNAFSYSVFEQLRAKRDAVQDFIAFKDVPLTATVDGQSDMINAELITGAGFQSLGIKASLGRTLTLADDTVAGSEPVAVISQGYWVQRFARSQAVIGEHIFLNGVPVTIVGVCGGHFAGLQLGNVSQIFLPLTMQPLVVPRAQNSSVSLLNNPQSWWVQVLVRLRTDVPEPRVQAELDAILRQVAMPVLTHTSDIEQFHLRLEPGSRGVDSLRGKYSRPSYVLLGLAGLILLLACVNLANLLLAGSASRRREITTRFALGASRGSIVRQMLTESILLSVWGGIAGLVFGYIFRNAIPQLLEGPSRPVIASVDFDGRVLLFTLGVSIATGLLFGVAPAWQSMRLDVNINLRDSGGATANRQRLLLDKALVLGQIALSAILLVGAGLFARTLFNLNHIPLGFEADRMLLFHLDPPRSRYSNPQMITLYKRLEQELADVPGVRSVTMSNIAIIGDGHSGSTFHVFGRPTEKDKDRVQANAVGADFFQTLGIPMLQGRAFTIHDTGASPNVAIVNRTLALKYFPGENPVGRTFETEADNADNVEEPIQIVGVAADTRYADLRSDTPPTFYVPYQQRSISGRMVVELRTASDPATVLESVRKTVQSIDGDLPLIDVRTMKEQIRSTLADERTLADLACAFSVLALVLASIGIYGIMAYTVSTRTSEIGLRIAFGAQPTSVLTAVLCESIVLTLVGILLGLGAALLMVRFIGSTLYGLGAADPLTASCTTFLLLTVSIIAAAVPARRASRIDPMRALRYE
jgi:predicted permease